ncbi:MAG: PQQ-binding-like beta-propeller repeat protein [Gemmataceae bacterium]
MVLSLVCSASFSEFARAADWSRFRGENGSGQTADALPLNWNASTTKWAVDLPGMGNGSPIVVKGHVYLQAASKDGSQRHLVSLNASTGKREWLTTISGKPAHVHVKNSLASSTPACDGERIYALFWDGDTVTLYGFDLAGKELWKKKLGGYVSQHGVGSSPIVVNGKVIVNYDQDGAAEIVAFDGKSGNKAWSASRKAFRACYSTPFMHGKNLVVSSTAGLTGYDPDSGTVVWNWEWKFDGMALRTVGSACEAGKLIVAISGDGSGARHTVVVDPESPMNASKPELKWEKKKDTPYVPGPIALGDSLYWVTDAGMAMCLELKTGKVVWSERLFSKPVSASLILTQSTSNEPLVLAISETGQSAFFKATPGGFEKVSENNLKDAVFATPAVADGRLYVRTGRQLVCIGK